MIHYGPVRKHLRIVKAMRDPSKGSVLLDALRSFLNAEEPILIRWLRSLWKGQQDAVSYGQLRDAILADTLSIEILAQWQQDYAKLVSEKIGPQWRSAMAGAAKEHSEHEFDPASEAIDRWIEEHSAELVKNLSAAQYEGLRVVIEQAAKGKYGPDELARVIRPMIGMTARQTKACERYYEGMRAEGLKADEAKKRALNYAANAHRYRAQSIARTELAFAYNQGSFEAISQAQARGYIGQVQKKWLTAEDERVCDFCGPLDNVSVPMDQLFPDGPALPPHHPQCRCTVVYEEVKHPE